VDAAETLPDVARRGIDLARLLEEGARSVVVVLPEQELRPAREQVLGADGRRIGLRVEGATGVQRGGGAGKVTQVAEDAGEVEQHLDLDPAAADPLLGAGLLPDVARPGQRLDGFARAVELLEAIAPAEQAQVVGRERLERPVVPAERLRPLLLPLEVPADGAVEDGRPARRQVGAAEQVPLDLVLVSEDAEGATDLVEEVRGVPGVVGLGVVEVAVAGHDRMMVSTAGQRTDVGEHPIDVPHLRGLLPAARTARRRPFQRPYSNRTSPPLPTDGLRYA
jgi:hypothetical protein